jgi:hypothetical protein
MYQLLHDDGKAARRACDHALNDIKTRYHISQADLETLSKIIDDFVWTAMGNAYDAATSECIELGYDKAIQELMELGKLQALVELNKIRAGIKIDN